MDGIEDEAPVVDQLVERLETPIDDTALLELLDHAAIALIESDLIHRLVPHARRLRDLDFADHPWAGLLGGVAICTVDRPRGRTELRRSREAFERREDRLGNGYACFLEGLEDIGEGQIATAADWWRRSRELLDGEGPVEGMALAHLALGAYADGDLRRAQLMANESLTTARRREDDRVIGIASMYLAFVDVHTGEFADADTALADGIAALDRLDPANRYELPMLLSGQACVACLRGAPELAEQRWNEAIEAATRDENRWYESITRVMRADFTATDNPRRAVEDARRALDYFSWAGEEWWVHWARTGLIGAHRSAGALATAAELARRLLAAPLTPLERGRALLAYGETLLALEDPAAVGLLEDAVECLDAAGAHYWAACAELLLAVVESDRSVELTTSIRTRAGAGLDDPAWLAVLDPATALVTHPPAARSTPPADRYRAPGRSSSISSGGDSPAGRPPPRCSSRRAPSTPTSGPRWRRPVPTPGRRPPQISEHPGRPTPARRRPSGVTSWPRSSCSPRVGPSHRSPPSSITRGERSSGDSPGSVSGSRSRRTSAWSLAPASSRSSDAPVPPGPG